MNICETLVWNQRVIVGDTLEALTLQGCEAAHLHLGRHYLARMCTAATTGVRQAIGLLFLIFERPAICPSTFRKRNSHLRNDVFMAVLGPCPQGAYFGAPSTSAGCTE